MIQNICILGDHIQALGLSRMASAVGLNVELFSDYNASITRFSNTCKRFHLFKNEIDLLQKLSSFNASENTVLVPTNDKLVTFIRNNYRELSEKFLLSVSVPEILDICLNKKTTYLKASELGIPFPESYFPQNLEDLIELSNKLDFPVIIKPAIMYIFYSKTGIKVYECNNPSELIINYKKFISGNNPEDVIIQEKLTGGAKNLFSFGAYAINGRVVASFVANRPRQKPMDFGISTCFAKTVIIEEVEKRACQFLNAINYSGMAEVEFMFDPKTNQYKLIEINPRSWKWHSIANKLNINLIEIMVQSMNGIPVHTKRNELVNIGWIERLTDSWIVLKEILKGQLSFQEYFQSLKINKEYACWSWEDPLPAIMYIILSPYLLIKR